MDIFSSKIKHTKNDTCIRLTKFYSFYKLFDSVLQHQNFPTNLTLLTLYVIDSTIYNLLIFNKTSSCGQNVVIESVSFCGFSFVGTDCLYAVQPKKEIFFLDIMSAKLHENLPVNYTVNFEAKYYKLILFGRLSKFHCATQKKRHTQANLHNG